MTLLPPARSIQFACLMLLTLGVGGGPPPPPPTAEAAVIADVVSDDEAAVFTDYSASGFMMYEYHQTVAGPFDLHVHVANEPPADVSATTGIELLLDVTNHTPGDWIGMLIELGHDVDGTWTPSTLPAFTETFFNGYWTLTNTFNSMPPDSVTDTELHFDLGTGTYGPLRSGNKGFGSLLLSLPDADSEQLPASSLLSDGYTFTLRLTPTVAPEPSSSLLFLLGLSGAGLLGRGRRRVT